MYVGSVRLLHAPPDGGALHGTRWPHTLTAGAPPPVPLTPRHALHTPFVCPCARAHSPDPTLPTGIAFRAYVPGQDDREVYQVIEDAFGEWPDRLPNTFEDWYPMVLGRASFEPWMVLLAADESTGEIVGVANGTDQDPDAGWVQQLERRLDKLV